MSLDPQLDEALLLGFWLNGLHRSQEEDKENVGGHEPRKALRHLIEEEAVLVGPPLVMQPRGPEDSTRADDLEQPVSLLHPLASPRWIQCPPPSRPSSRWQHAARGIGAKDWGFLSLFSKVM